MKRIIQILSLSLLGTALLLSGCFDLGPCIKGDGPIVEETLNLAPITGIDLGMAATVYVYRGEGQSVRIRGEENIISEIDLEVNSRGLWKIDTKKCLSNEKIEVFITVPSLSVVKLSGSGDIEVVDSFEEENVEMEISGSGNISMRLQAGSVSTSIRGSGNLDIRAEAILMNADIAGSGSILLSGSVEELNVSIAGSGDVNAFEVSATRSEVKIGGSGSAELQVSDILNVNISGSGSVYYMGNPAVQADISGSGKIINAN